MSMPATLGAIYLAIGLLLMVVAMAVGTKRRRARALDGLIDGTEPGAWLLFAVAAFWPIWLMVALIRRGKRDKVERRPDAK